MGAALAHHNPLDCMATAAARLTRALKNFQLVSIPALIALSRNKIALALAQGSTRIADALA